ncbi:ABC-2 transporter permease [Neomoorella carbonis]|uniref:ABC-2 transporter permease n=1 Tax=Neomoorella carbonis TaxID=3062783 RepID=UPI0032543883
MWTLIAKDLRVLRSSILTYALMAAAMILFFSRMENGNAFIAFWSLFLPYFYVGRMCYQEEVDGGLGLLRSLPVSPGTIVASKFAGGLLLTIGGSLLVIVAGGLAHWLGWFTPQGGISLLFISLAFPLALVLVLEGLVFLVFFTWDYRRASYVMLLPLLGLLPLAFPSLFRPVVGWVLDHITVDSWFFLPGLLLESLICYLALGLLAGRVFSRRDVG